MGDDIAEVLDLGCTKAKTTKRLETAQKVGNSHSAKSVNEVKQIYANWSETYEEDVHCLGYRGPKQCGEAVEKVLRDKSAKILDCASGTGLVAETLANIGYTNIDGVDCSKDCLTIAASKGIYKRLICDTLGKNRLDIETDTYDAIVNVGGFIPGHLKEDCLEEWIRIVKPGGYIWILTRENVKMFKEKLGAEMQELERKGQWKLVYRVSTKNYIDDGPGVCFLYQIL